MVHFGQTLETAAVVVATEAAKWPPVVSGGLVKGLVPDLALTFAATALLAVLYFPGAKPSSSMIQTPVGIFAMVRRSSHPDRIRTLIHFLFRNQERLGWRGSGERI
jgi:hypothetical protein